MMTREGFLQEDEEASMLNILFDHGSGAFDRGDGPSTKNTNAVLSSHGDTCVVLVCNT